MITVLENQHTLSPLGSGAIENVPKLTRKTPENLGRGEWCVNKDADSRAGQLLTEKMRHKKQVVIMNPD